MGFNNEGIGKFVRRLSAAPRSIGIVGANVGANKDSEDRIADYVAGVKAVWSYSRYITINVSSPNTPGLRGLQDRSALAELLGRVGDAAREMGSAVKNRPVFLKVAPDLDDKAITDIAEVTLAQDWLAGLIVSNTTIDRPETLVSAHKRETGGLSGAPLMEKSTRILAAFHAVVGDRLDLIGAGGITSAGDVIAKLRAGAQAVQLYSALVFHGPLLVRRIKADLIAVMEAEGLTSLSAFRAA
jgi:dihydroorotate dehydrogenase